MGNRDACAALRGVRNGFSALARRSRTCTAPAAKADNDYGEPTYEGLCKLLAVGLPCVGIFARKVDNLSAGHGMADDASCAPAGLSAL